MSEAKLYYTPPTDDQFNELKNEAIKIWIDIASYPSYAKEKIERIKDLKNVQDNFMYMVAMFDIHNQRRLANELSEETKQAVRERMIDGGQPEEYIVF